MVKLSHKQPMIRRLTQRSAGILLHPTSLPNSYAIGDIGPSAHDFIDFLAAAGQHWWQMLPLNPVGAGNSPYQSFSSFASNPLLISPDALVNDGWLDASQLSSFYGGSKNKTAYPLAGETKHQCLMAAFDRFESSARAADKRALAQFVEAQRSWLPDYSLFVALHAEQDGRPWWLWEPGLRRRDPGALAAARKSLARMVRLQEFIQWQFEIQWQALRQHGARRGVGFIGDLPLFVAADSADVWAHPHLFTLHPDGSPAFVAGVPPDYFSNTGQLWGNPHYRWQVMKKDGYAWWAERLKTILRCFDAVRIDHFIGLVRFYEIPGNAKTAIHGRYKKGPGADFFHSMLKELGTRGKESLIAEDLGKVTPEVKALRDTLGFPGMKILQFAFGDDPEARSFQPHNYPPNCIAYTGTHDNNTSVGWFIQEALAHPKEAEFARRYLNSDGRHMAWDMIRTVLASPANTAIIPMQDLLGLGPESRMNLPGTPTGNWEWRMPPGMLTPELAERLRHLSETYERLT